MALLPFVLLLTIPVAMVARRSPLVTLMVAVWAFFLSLTSLGPGIHAAAISAGRAILAAVGGH